MNPATAEENLTATLLSESIAPSTGWPVETWVIREPGMTPIAQVQLCHFREKNPETGERTGHAQWYLWTHSIVSSRIRRLGMRLQDARNGVERAETLNF